MSPLLSKEGPGIKISDEEFLNEAKTVIDKAQEKGIILRILGALAIHIHSEHTPRCIELHKSLGRLGEKGPTFTDLDLIAYKKQRKEVKNFFEKDLKFVPDRRINTLFGGKRYIFYHPKGAYYVDIFFSKLEFSHDVDFGEAPQKGRLELDYPTITLADLVLEKTQIHDINLKDIIDLIVLFLGHPVEKEEKKEAINGKYIAEVLANDWGFWYDATNNLNKVKNFAEKFYNEGKITEEEYKTVIERIDTLLKMIEEEPKTKAWQKRAKKGTKKIWYRPVEEVIR